MGFSRQQYWSGLPCPPPGDLPNPRINPCLLHLLHWQILYHECYLGSPIHTGINYMYVFLYVETNILPSIFTLTVNKSGMPISISFSFYSSHNPPYWFQFEKQCIRLKKLLTAIKRAVFPSFNNFKIQTAIAGYFFVGRCQLACDSFSSGPQQWESLQSLTTGLPGNSDGNFFKINFYWVIIDLQCCITFCGAANWISYT